MCAVGYNIFCTDASSGGSSARRPRHCAGALERRRVKSRGGGEEVPSLERKIGACGEGAELKWGGRLLRNGARREYAIIFGRHGAGVGYVHARIDVSFGRLGEALSAG
jgi:hypothetical protein